MQMRSSKPACIGFWNRFSPALLTLSWVTGMVLGAGFAYLSKQFLVPMVIDSVSAQLSITGLVSAGIVPFLLSAFAVFFCEPWLLLIISMFKAFSFSFCATGVSLAFVQSSWLVRFLFLFSDILIIPVLYVYWLRCLSHRCKVKRWELSLYLCIAGLIVYLDCHFIAPFLKSLLNI